MARGAGKGGNSGKDTPDSEEIRLWEEYTRDIAPVKKKPSFQKEPRPAKETPPRKKEKAAPLPAVKNTSHVQHAPPQLDARLDQRLRRGQVPLDGTLDLHGMTQAEAHEKLNGYIVRAHGQGKRCLLVITGKGRGGEGVLKQNFPQWMAMPPLGNIVLKIVPAAQSHGGSGAWYVYLKRIRDY